MYMNASYHTAFIVYVYLIADIIQYDVLYILCCMSLCIVESVERQSNTASASQWGPLSIASAQLLKSRVGHNDMCKN